MASSPHLDTSQPLRPATQLPTGILEKAVSHHVHSFPTEYHTIQELHPTRPVQRVATPVNIPSTSHQLFARDQYKTYVACEKSAMLAYDIGLVCDQQKLLMQRSEPKYPKSGIPVDESVKLDLNQDRDLVDRHRERFPYNGVCLPALSKDPSFITFEKMPYAHYRNINGDRYLATVRTELPITPTPTSFLQPRFFFMPPHIDGKAPQAATGPLINFILDWRDEGPIENDEFPISLHEIVRAHSPWPIPTVTQIVDLTTKIVAEMDWLSRLLYYTPTLTTIYITNPSQIGTDKPLAFKLCPFALGMNDELPSCVERNIHIRRFTALLIFELSLWITESYRLDFHHLIPESFISAPGMLSAYHEIMRESKFDIKSRLKFDEYGYITEFYNVTDEPRNLSEQSNSESNSRPMCYMEALQEKLKNLTESGSLLSSDETKMIPVLSLKSKGDVPVDMYVQSFSPTIATFNNVRAKSPKQYSFEHVPGLLQTMACVHSRTINTSASDALYTILKKQMSQPNEFASKIGSRLINTCAVGLGAFVPVRKTGLTDPSSVSQSRYWIGRMFSIFIILDEVERTGRYSLLKTLQQVNLSAGIGTQLGGNLARHDRKFSLSVLVPVVCVSVLSSFQFPILKTRLIFDRNVRKMSKMLLDAEKKRRAAKMDYPPFSTGRIIGMMMVMSDFGSWCNMDLNNDDVNDEDFLLAKAINELTDEEFLAKVLPCWSPSLSNETTTWISGRLEGIARDTLETMETAPISRMDELKVKLSYVLDWCVHFAWNGVEQVVNSTYNSIYTSYFLSIVFRRPQQTIFEMNQNSAFTRARSSKYLKSQQSTSSLIVIRDANFVRPNIDSLASSRDNEIDLDALIGSPPETNSRPGIGLQPLGTTQPQRLDRESLVKNKDRLVASSMGKSYITGSQVSTMDWDSSDSEEDGILNIRSITTPESSSSTPQVTPLTKDDDEFKPIQPPFSTSCPESYSTAMVRLHPYLPTDDPTKTESTRVFLPPDAFHNVMFSYMSYFNIYNQHEYSIVPITYKLAIGLANIVDFVEDHRNPNHNRLYVPMAAHNGAPEGDSDCYFSLPSVDDEEKRLIKYHVPQAVLPVPGAPPLRLTSLEGRHNSVRSLQEGEVKELYPSDENPQGRFIPTTLVASNLPLCSVRNQVIGTTGMMELTLVDSGVTNDVVIGITWSLHEEGRLGPLHTRKDLQFIVPGFTPTSLGLSSSGVLYYINNDGNQFACPYTEPFGTGSKISIGIAYNRVYFVVDSVFYPPVPGLLLPKSSNIHGLIRFGCLGIKIKMRHLASCWNQSRNHDGSLVHAATNPVAHTIYLSELRTKVCPHYHAHRRSNESRPKMSNILPVNSRSLDEWTPRLGETIVKKMKFIKLSEEECSSENCPALSMIRQMIQEMCTTAVTSSE